MNIHDENPSTLFKAVSMHAQQKLRNQELMNNKEKNEIKKELDKIKPFTAIANDISSPELRRFQIERSLDFNNGMRSESPNFGGEVLTEQTG